MDKYDEAIRYLTEHPDQIQHAWFNYDTHPSGCLFSLVAPDGTEDPVGHHIGCLTMVHWSNTPGESGYWKVWQEWPQSLNEEIGQDSRIPDSARDITVESLPVFAEWQRKLDKEYRNVAS